MPDKCNVHKAKCKCASKPKQHKPASKSTKPKSQNRKPKPVIKTF